MASRIIRQFDGCIVRMSGDGDLAQLSLKVKPCAQDPQKVLSELSIVIKDPLSFFYEDDVRAFFADHNSKNKAEEPVPQIKFISVLLSVLRATSQRGWPLLVVEIEDGVSDEALSKLIEDIVGLIPQKPW